MSDNLIQCLAEPVYVGRMNEYALALFLPWHPVGRYLGYLYERLSRPVKVCVDVVDASPGTHLPGNDYIIHFDDVF